MAKFDHDFSYHLCVLCVDETPAILASAEDNIMCPKKENLLRIGLLRGGSIVGSFEGSDCSVLRKKWPPMREQVFVSVRYDALECTHNNILDA